MEAKTHNEGSTFPKVEYTNFERSTNPLWAGDFFDRKALLPGGALLVAAEFPAVDAVNVTASGNAVIDATSILIAATPIPTGKTIPAGTILRFGAKKFAKLTAAAVAGATALTVEALAVQIDAADVATYAGSGLKTAPSGFVVGRTIAERDADTGYGVAADADDEVRIIAFDVPNVDVDPQVEIVRPGFLVYENHLPGFANLSATIKSKLRAAYQMTKGVQ